jgi:hypothetical protein
MKKMVIALVALVAMVSVAAIDGASAGTHRGEKPEIQKPQVEKPERRGHK